MKGAPRGRKSSAASAKVTAPLPPGLGISEEVWRRVLSSADRRRISVEQLMEITGVSIDNDPAEFALLEAALESAGISIVDAATPEDTDAEDVPEKVSFAELDPLQIYIQEIGRTPLLDPKRELELGKRISESLAMIREICEKTGLPAQELRKYRRVDGAEAPPPVKGQDRRNLAKLAGKLVDAENDFAEAQRTLIEANLRLVVSIAKRYVYHGLHLLDLINEGNLGLIRAVERYDYRRGFKFSTYASWWIRQAIRRAIADQGRIIRVPVHMSDSISRWIKATRTLSQKFGREPSVVETAKEMGISELKLLEIVKVSQEPSSLEAPLLSTQESSLAEVVEDTYAVSPYKTVLSLVFTEHLSKMLSTLQEKERKIIEMRFGLMGRNEHTLEEVGVELGITRERVRQLEMRALKKLRHLRLAEELFSMMVEMGR